jgi:hypothetical protein
MPYIQNNGGKNIKYQWKTNSQKRGVNEKKSDFGNRNI